jgi:hypothetical protein
MYCPHCGNRAPQHLIHNQQHEEILYDTKDGSERIVDWSTFVVVCETCKNILLYTNPFDEFTEEEFHLGDLIYPRSGKLHKSVPKMISDVYDEAFRIREIAPNAFAVQVRRSLEAICEDRGENKGRLQEKLNGLAKKNEIPPTLSEASDVLRLIGNIGAHGINQSVHPLQASAIDDFFRAIVEYVYVAPQKLTDFKERMENYQRFKEAARGAHQTDSAKS